MNILICISNRKAAKRLENQLVDYGTNTKRFLNIYCLNDLSDISDSKIAFDIAVIEWNYNKTKETELIESLINRYPNIKTVFISDSLDLLDMCMDFGAIRYLIKPFGEEKLLSGVVEAIKRVESQTITLNLKRGLKNDRVNIKDIMFIEIVNRKTKIVTTNKTYYSNESLSYWKDRLRDYGFVSTHISYLVNIEHITQYKRNGYVILNDKYTVPISRSKGPSFHDYYTIKNAS